MSRQDTTAPRQPTNSGDREDSSEWMENVVRQVIRQVTPGILDAAKTVATEVSSTTQQELQKWKQLQEERRKRDNVTFKQEGNQEQFTHASEVLTEFENADFYMETEKWAKAKEALNKGKELVRERVKLIRLADGTNWQTVKEYKNGACGVDEASEKRWKSAQKAVKEREDERSKAKYREGRPYWRPENYRPYLRWGEDSPSVQC